MSSGAVGQYASSSKIHTKSPGPACAATVCSTALCDMAHPKAPMAWAGCFVRCRIEAAPKRAAASCVKCNRHVFAFGPRSVGRSEAMESVGYDALQRPQHSHFSPRRFPPLHVLGHVHNVGDCPRHCERPPPAAAGGRSADDRLFHRARGTATDARVRRGGRRRGLGAGRQRRLAVLSPRRLAFSSMPVPTPSRRSERSNGAPPAPAQELRVPSARGSYNSPRRGGTGDLVALPSKDTGLLVIKSFPRSRQASYFDFDLGHSAATRCTATEAFPLGALKPSI